MSILKLAQYADDITMFLRDKNGLERVLEIVKECSEISQLTINTNKTEAMWLWSMQNCKEDYCNIKWKTQLNIVGIIIQSNTTASDIQENWTKRLENVDKIITRCATRNLSISGKFMYNKNIFNFTVCLSNASTHCSTANPSETKHDYYSDIILWKKKYSNTRAFEKVKRTVVCSSTEEGGINMINVHDMQASFVLAWATKWQQPGNQNWKLIPRILFN